MATPSSSSDPFPDSTNGHSDVESNTTVAEEYSYCDGALAWGTSSLKDHDIITVIGQGGSHTIFSLVEPFQLQIHTATLPQDFLDVHLFQLPAHLRPDNNLHVLVSTLSGTGLSPAFFDGVLHPLLRAIGLECNVVRTSSAESVMEFARSLLPDANRGQKQTVIMLSGDGGMVDTINGLLGGSQRSSFYVKPILSQIPLATGNALFHSLHKSSPIPSIYIQGLRTLLHGSPKSLPIFRAQFSTGARLLTDEGQTATPLTNNSLYGAVVASYGLHATLVADSDTTEYRKHGDKRFALVAKNLMFPEAGGDPHAYDAQVILTKDDTEVLERKKHGYVLASLVSNLEKTFTISPESKPFDGKLRIVHFGPLSGDENVTIMRAAYNNGSHLSIDSVGYETVSGMRIEFEEEGEEWKWRRCCVDGLIVGVEEGGYMEVGLVRAGEEAVDVVADV